MGVTSYAQTARRQLLRLFGAFIAAGLLVGYITPASPSSAQSFNPGNIVADSVFYNPYAMTAAQANQFLRDRNPNCAAVSGGQPCLKDYRESTWTRTSTVCPGTYVGVPNESAGEILVKVGQACGINPQALIVTLQKEQGLVTATGSALTARKYQIAMGFGCPDSAPCDSQYYGFYNQVFSAAQQFQRYRQNPSRYGYRAGMANTVGYHPNAGCGSSVVTIANQATAGLYNYTPYQPNAALLNGRADTCSSYGNHNFWQFFTNWFGDPQGGPPPSSSITELWTYLGGNAGLGAATTPGYGGLAGGGSGQFFAGGAIFSSTAGTFWIPRTFAELWVANGREEGLLRYPSEHPQVGTNGLYYQGFQGGVIATNTSGGASLITGSVATLWTSTGSMTLLGAPVTARFMGLSGGGSVQPFANGTVWTTPSGGTFWVPSMFDQAWNAAGREAGFLGYPLAHPVGYQDGSHSQQFQGGILVKRVNQPAISITGSVADLWLATGAVNGLGAPITSRFYGLSGGGSAQPFVNGAIWTTPGGGTHWVPSAFDQAWNSTGREVGTLGYPLESPVGYPDGSHAQKFQGGFIVQGTNGLSVAVTGSVSGLWAALGGINGLGAPITARFYGLPGGGSVQPFKNGTIWTTPSGGTFWVPSTFDQAWNATGRENGRLGYPSSNPVLWGNGVLAQSFTGGAITASPGQAAYAW